MNIFDLMKENKQEQIAFYTDTSVRLRTILAIHSTALGPAIGGIRIMRYSTEEEAMFDLVRLSRAMTYKTAAAGLNFGGGEVVILDQGMPRQEGLFRSLGRFIESLKGRIIVGGDIGVTEESMEFMRRETRYVTGLPAYYGGSGDHDSMCAYGTFLGILACARFKWGSDDLAGKSVVVQGYGRVGSRLSVYLKEKGADVTVADILPERTADAENKGYRTVCAGKVYSRSCDIFSPCAVGAVINKETVDAFVCEIIAGSANNQLLSDVDDLKLRKRGILWAPDFIINAGGIIDVVEEYLGYKPERVKKKTEHIYGRTLQILTEAYDKNRSAQETALSYARRRIETIKNLRGTFPGKGRM